MRSPSGAAASPAARCRIRASPDPSLLTAPRGFSQPATPFIGSWRRGIPRAPFRAPGPGPPDPPHAGPHVCLVPLALHLSRYCPAPRPQGAGPRALGRAHPRPPAPPSAHPARGGAEEIRTPDLRRAKAALSRLSYGPAVGVPGIEPGTSVLSGPRSDRLSYTPAALARAPGPAPAKSEGEHGGQPRAGCAPARPIDLGAAPAPPSGGPGARTP